MFFLRRGFFKNGLISYPHYISELWDIVNPKNPVIFVNTDEAELTEEKSGSFIINRGEAIIVKRLINILVQCGLSQHDVGVISMYRKQVNLIRDEIADLGMSIEVDTMDKYQVGLSSYIYFL